MIENKSIVEYYYTDVYNKRTVTVSSLIDALEVILTPADKNNIYITTNRYLRKLLGITGHEVRDLKSTEKLAEEFYLLIQLFKKLNAKGIPCYRFFRTELLSANRYTPLAQKRIRDGLSFPKMSQDYVKYEKHFKEILGERCSVEYVDNLRKIPQVLFRGETYGHEDAQSPLVNTFCGRRVVPNCPLSCKRTIHFYGRCGAFGYAVEDADTIPSHLQKLLSASEYDIAVINHGMWGADDSLLLNNLIVEAADFKDSDIVILYEKGISDEETLLLEKCGVYCSSTTEAFHDAKESAYCFYDRPGHMSGEGYEIIANYILHKMEETGFICRSVAETIIKTDKEFMISYLEKNKQAQFCISLKKYLDEIGKSYPKLTGNSKTGAIVMNCNPFTLGHRYLIEYASARVDRLFVFVLQEDKSFFPFVDRFEMVKSGTRDLKNVVVLPSGEFMISTLTFPEYFMKEYKKSKNFDATKDLTIFTNEIAAQLGISVRFAGEEPFDVVTREYNRNMSVILPRAGIDFCEIPRKKLDDSDDIVSATKVRTLMKENAWEEIRRYVPDTTYDYLIGNFGNSIN